jgi:hypothetical protein
MYSPSSLVDYNFIFYDFVYTYVVIIILYSAVHHDRWYLYIKSLLLESSLVASATRAVD